MKKVDRADRAEKSLNADLEQWTEKLVNVAPFPEALADKGGNGYPKCEWGYVRCDYDGNRWWNTVWPLNGALMTPELSKEFDKVYGTFVQAFPNREAMRKFCVERAERTEDETEFNAYMVLEHGFYWFRMITRKGDYNLYLHCLSRAAMATSQSEEPRKEEGQSEEELSGEGQSAEPQTEGQRPEELRTAEPKAAEP